MSKYTLHRPNNVQVSRAIDLYNAALNKFKMAQVKSEQTLLHALFESIYTFFATMQKPRLSKRLKVVPGTNPDPKKYNDFQEAVVSDLNAYYTQQNAVEDIVISNFNLQQTERNRLDIDYKQVKYDSDAYTLFSRFPDRIEFILRDDFTNTSKVDLTFPIETTAATIDTGAGASTLAVKSISPAWTSMSDMESIDVLHDLPKEDTTEDEVSRTKPDVDDWYEGKMFGIWPSELGEEDGFRISGADVDASFSSRLNLVDLEDGSQEHPSTFWEFEVVILEGVAPKWDAISDSSAANVGELLRLSSAFPGKPIQQAITNWKNSPLEVKIPQGIYFKGQQEVDAWVWNQTPKYASAFKFDLSLILTLKEAQRLSTLSVTPYTFGKSATPEILGVYTKTTEDEGWVSIENRAAPSKLLSPTTAGDVQQTGTAIDSSIISWNFETRNVKQIKIEFRQSQGYKIKYSVMLLGKHWSIHTKEKGGWFAKDKHSWETISKWAFVDVGGRDFVRQLANAVKLTLPSEELAAALQGGHTLSTGERIGSITASAAVGATIGSIVPAIGTAIGAVIGAIAGSFKSIASSIFGGKIEKKLAAEWEDPLPVSEFEEEGEKQDGFYDIDTAHSNRIRYAIGIQDISSAAKVFVKEAERVSNNFFTPEPIFKIALDVNEEIPKLFKTMSPETRWIKYYISIDNGITFHRINPMNAPTITFDDSDMVVPKIITINSALPLDRRSSYPFGHSGFIDTDKPAHNIRLKWAISRPNDLVALSSATDATSPSAYSPILHDYGLRITPRIVGGIKRS